MEESRLKPMVENYDQQMFNRLYAKTHGLRRKLASEINPHRFGLQFDDVLSWFDIKFIFVFNKYFNQHNEEVLLGHLINALGFFKCRILRGAYTHKFSQAIVHTDSVIQLEDHLIEYHPAERTQDLYYNKLMDFMKANLSLNAFTILEIQLNPPPYILSRLNTHIDANLRKIPDPLLLEYFDLGTSDNAYKFLNGLKKEIRNATNYAKLHFKNTP